MTEVIHDKVCTVSKYDINIKDSYTVTERKEMNEILYVISHRYPDCEVFKVRKWDNLVEEWCAHNLLYKLKYKQSQTGSVDLDTGEPWWRRTLYTIISWFY